MFLQVSSWLCNFWHQSNFGQSHESASLSSWPRGRGTRGRPVAKRSHIKTQSSNQKCSAKTPWGCSLSLLSNLKPNLTLIDRPAKSCAGWKRSRKRCTANSMPSLPSTARARHTSQLSYTSAVGSSRPYLASSWLGKFTCHDIAVYTSGYIQGHYPRLSIWYGIFELGRPLSVPIRSYNTWHDC